MADVSRHNQGDQFRSISIRGVQYDYISDDTDSVYNI